MLQTQLFLKDASAWMRIVWLARCACISGLLYALSACASSPFQLDKIAKQDGLHATTVVTKQFEHAVYTQAGSDDFQVVFIEGDGRPWNDSGSAASLDPTPHTALAYQLLRQTPVNALYVTRPCYFGLPGVACAASVWTHGRYAQHVVDSLQHTIEANSDATKPIVLIGHSGGGSLAVLLAAQMHNVFAIITVAGLLDTQAWTDHHGYEPLAQSLQPANAMLDSRIRQFHLVGELDANVPPAQTRRAVTRWPMATVWSYPQYDHACCWQRDWPTIWTRIAVALSR